MARRAAAAVADLPISECTGWDCRALPIPSGETVRILGSGLRNARTAAEIEVTLDGVRVPVISFGPWSIAGSDQLTIRIPAAMAPHEADLLCRVGGRISNPVRIRIGTPAPLLARTR